MSWEKIKLNKQLVRSLIDAGFTLPKELQLKTLNRIIGGQDIVGIGPQGSGKTTTLILAALNRFKHSAENVPLVLILTADQEKVEQIIEQFDGFNRNKTIRIVTLHTGNSIDQQMDDLADGADIVVATPDRARAVYLKLGLNLNKVELLIVDEAQDIVKKGLQLPTTELSTSIGKAQRLVFSEVMHDKLDKMISPLMHLPATIEVDDLGEQQVSVLSQMLYHVPNFGTKLNLLNLFLQDAEIFNKVVLFCNTRQTAETVYNNLLRKARLATALVKPLSFEHKSVKDVEEFKVNDQLRLLIIANETDEIVDLTEIPFIIHLDLPGDNDTYIKHIEQRESNTDIETIALTFATDLELDQVRRIEQLTGHKMQRADLPEDLVIEKDRKDKEAEKAAKPKQVHKPADKYTPGEAFHQKKPENAKSYNYSSSMKAKMNKKKKH
ncbi:DEAD/DEAH box helicase [Mucilaginibacter litoreus]|uniref:DEAD/DEAH box helicase n=1 Tax=Mucilaginibacter litoreus TaxID=1048221 RepID=A0ABW3AUG8_9SPHI